MRDVERLSTVDDVTSVEYSVSFVSTSLWMRTMRNVERLSSDLHSYLSILEWLHFMGTGTCQRMASFPPPSIQHNAISNSERLMLKTQW